MVQEALDVSLTLRGGSMCTHTEKVVTFYLEVQGQLASRLWTLRRRERADAKAGGTGAALTLCAEYQALARDMGKLLDYACIVSGSGRLSAEG